MGLKHALRLELCSRDRLQIELVTPVNRAVVVSEAFVDLAADLVAASAGAGSDRR